MKKTATIETKTLTPEEKRAKRAAYAREYYAKNKEARIAAVKKCRAAKKAMNPAADGTEAKNAVREARALVKKIKAEAKAKK